MDPLDAFMTGVVAEAKAAPLKRPKAEVTRSNQEKQEIIWG